MPFLNSYQRARLLLLSASIICFAIFWWASALFRIPIHPGHEASLLQQPQSILSLILLAIILFVCVAIGSILAGMIRFDAGLAVASLGLMAISLRGGSIRYSIFHALSHGSSSPYLLLFIELLIFGIIVGAIDLLLRALQKGGMIRDRDVPLPPAQQGEDVKAFTAQTAITAVGIFILAPIEHKQQALAAVGISSFAAASIVQNTIASTSRTWFWAPPILVGLAGYLLAWIGAPSGLPIADPRGLTAPLARPLPLDYASVGVAGAIVGHWIGRRWRRERENNATPSSPAPA